MKVPRPSSMHRLGLCLALLCLPPSLSHSAVTAGGLAIIGYTDNAATDSFTVVALDGIDAGEVLYFTNNGWGNTSMAFDGASLGGTSGAGAEQLMKLTVNSSIAAGTVFSSADTSNSAFTWTTSGVIPTGNIGNTDVFSNLNLKHNGPYDEVYIFQAGDTNPLLNVSGFVYAIDFGDALASPSGFRELDGTAEGGNVPDGFVSVDGGFNTYEVDTVALGTNGNPNDNTAVELNPDGDPLVDFFGGTFGFNMSHPDVVALQGTGGTKEEWLALIADREHWSPLGSQPNQDFSIAGVPEPSRMILAFLGAFPLILRRRRKM